MKFLVNLLAKFNYKKAEEFVSVFFAIFVGFFTIGLFKICNYFTFFSLDEMLWHSRSRLFWDRILTGDYENLILSAQPGITVYWFGGFLMKFVNGFDPYMIGRMIREREALGEDFNFINADDQVLYAANQAISFVFNIPLIFWMVVFFIAFYYLVRKLGFNRIISYFALFFLTTNLYLAYWTTPSDKMLNIFLTLSLLSFLVYITKKGEKKYFWFSSVLGALAVLSKLSAFFILPFYFLMSILFSEKIDIAKIKNIFKDYIIWLIIFILIAVIFLPTIIFYPNEIYELIFRPSNDIYETAYVPVSYFSRLAEFLDKFFRIIILSNLSTASSILFLFFFPIYFSKKFRDRFEDIPRKTLLVILIYFFSFGFMVTVVSGNHDIRFMSPIFTIMSIFSGTAAYILIKYIVEKFKINYGKKYIFVAFISIIIMSNIVSIVTSSYIFDSFVEKYFGFELLHF